MQNLDQQECDKFAELADTWWDGDGPGRTLHDINPTRLAYIASACPLAGIAAADIGCGGGLLSEAMARAGARVTAIDASAELIEVARRHAAGAQLEIDYRTQLAHELAALTPAAFDLVTCMELIEHVPDPDALIGDCAALMKPGAVLVVATLSRTPTAYLSAILGAEYLLRLLPRGTHAYDKFIRPAELVACARRHSLVVTDITAMHYNPLTRRATLGGTVRVNYLARFRYSPQGAT